MTGRRQGKIEGRRKVQDLGEIKRWYEEGVSFPEMVVRYREKYNIDTSASMFANIRLRQGWERRNLEQANGLLPWDLLREHWYAYDAIMLRSEARERAGMQVNEQARYKLRGWRQFLADNDAVVHYEPEIGFVYVPARPGDDLIRTPDGTTVEAESKTA